MPRVTLRDLADRQHGPSKAVRDLSADNYGGWRHPHFCERCTALLTATDYEATYCTQCGKEIS